MNLTRICQNLTFEDNEFKDNKALNDQGKNEFNTEKNQNYTIREKTKSIDGSGFCPKIRGEHSIEYPLDH